MAAVALLFRYADFVTLLGGTEFHLGWIVGVGMVGSLLTRLVLGSCIDRYGARLLWLLSTGLFVATCFAHLTIGSHRGLAIYGLRISYCCAIAGVYGASMTFVTARAPTRRMAELVAMLGTAGFLGTVLGTLMGDGLFGSVAVDRRHVSLMFIAAAVTGLTSLPFAWAASRSEKRPTAWGGPSMFTVLRRHYSGMVLVVGVAMGMGLTLPNTFLRTYAAGLHIPRIGLFFLVYAIAAIITRVVARRWFERFGTRPLVLLAITGLAISQGLFLLVNAEWKLLWPAIGFGGSHALVFPAIVAAGSMSFPARNRGLATLLVLAAWDVGQLVGAPLAGVVVHYSEAAGLPPYPTMFLTVAGLLVLVGIWYAVVSRGRAECRSDA
jgi:MFS family permease